MPLCTTTIRPVQSRWGWAFSSVGRPCVAQRVWPMPKVPAMGSLDEDGFEVAKLPRCSAEVHCAVGRAGDGDAGRVITAVLEAAQAFDDDGHGGIGANVSDDSTHGTSVASGVRR